MKFEEAGFIILNKLPTALNTVSYQVIVTGANFSGVPIGSSLVHLQV